jgi:riboflavin kinase / FMN adenylyltransferase
VRAARRVDELERRPRAVAVGTFDGVHRGHQRVLAETVRVGATPTVVTFDPHPRSVLGNQVELLSSLDRRLELLAELGVEDALVLEFTRELAQLEPADFAEQVLRPLGTETVVAGETFRFGRSRSGDLATLGGLGFETRAVPLVNGISSTEIRALLRGGNVNRAAHALGRPPGVEGLVVAGDARGGTLGFPTANLRVAPELLVPLNGIYAGFTNGHPAAISIGTNPHYGGTERRVEAFLLDFVGDLYGERLVVELWQRLRDERAFPTEGELVAQIARDVEQTRSAERPNQGM